MRRRSGYIHVLLAIALMMAITFDLYGWTWLPLAFPAMGVLFAAGAERTAGTLDRAGSARVFYRRSLLPLLAPFWVFAAVAVPTMLALGWRTAGAGVRLDWSTGWLWVLPLFDPPASTQGVDWTVTLWFVRAYLWFLLLTPPLLWLFRRWPLRLMTMPVVMTLLITVGIANFYGRTYDVVIQMCAFGCCWLLGFAHHDDRLRKLSLPKTVAGGAALVGLGLWSWLLEQEEYAAATVYDVPVAGMFYSLGTVWILLRLDPRRAGAERRSVEGGALSFIGRRAITAYVWSSFAIAMTPLVLSRSPLAGYYTDDLRGTLLGYGATWVLILAAVLLVGWAEDLGTGRLPRIPVRRRAAAPEPTPLYAPNIVADVGPYKEPQAVVDLVPAPGTGSEGDVRYRP